MTIVEAEKMLAEVESHVRIGDDDAARATEYRLHREVLEAVSKGTNIYHVRKLAIIALKSVKVQLRRGL